MGFDPQSMRFVSPVLRKVIYPTLSKIGYLHTYAERVQLSVLTYHGVLPAGYEVMDPQLDGSWVTPDGFRRQMRLLHSHHNIVSPSQVRLWCKGEGSLPPRAVLLTCDDGLVNAVTDMLPILQEEGLTCLFFVTSRSLAEEPSMLWYEELYLTLLDVPEGALEGTFCGVSVKTRLDRSASQRTSCWYSMVDMLSTCDPQVRLGFARAIREKLGFPQDWSLQYFEQRASRFRLLALPEIRQLLSAGMEIGSHTMSHPKLSRLRAESSWEEINASRCDLERALGVPVWSIAYPFGGIDSVSDREMRMAEKAGYDCAFINFGGGFRKDRSWFGIPRVHIALDMTVSELEAHVSGLHEDLRRRFGRTEQIPSS
jgi:peptidoglycan/xylan/chitin deacetylase (PgdA/CDA1 family)